MIITQLNLTDTKGGAAIAAYRLHKGLRKIGQDSYMLVRKKLSSAREVFQIEAKESTNNRMKALFWRKFLQEQYVNDSRSDLSNTVFCLPYPGYDLTKSGIIHQSDIINMHWIAYFQSIVTLKKLFATGIPIVWTLHDQWAFSGGCHYSAGCNEYMDTCAACPQLIADPLHLPQAILKDKINYFKDADLTIVTPGRWLASCAKKSRLFKDLRVEVIPNSLEIDRFFPIPKNEAKKKIGVPENSLALLFVAEIVNEKRKGFRELLDAIYICKKDRQFRKLMQQDMIHILCLGEPSSDLSRSGIPVKPLGYLYSEEKIREAYNAADLYVLSSLEDNLPNTMLESMACGTPVVAFNVGGMPDMIRNGETGALAENRNPEELGEAILGLLYDPLKRERLGKNCRELIEQKYALHHQAENYLALYKELVKQKKSHYKKSNLFKNFSRKADAPGIGSETDHIPDAVPPGISENEACAVVLDGGISANVKKVFVKVLKKNIVEAVPANTPYRRFLKKMVKFLIYSTPVSLVFLLCRLLPVKTKDDWMRNLKERI